MQHNSNYSSLSMQENEDYADSNSMNYSTYSNGSYEGNDCESNEETDIGSPDRKRRRLKEDGESSDSDSSIELIAERDLDGVDEDSLDLLRALDDPQAGEHATEVARSEISTDAATDSLEQGIEQVHDSHVRDSGIGEVQRQETVDLEAEILEQQVVEVPESDIPEAVTGNPAAHKSVRDYRCPICFEPPDTAVMTPCGHIFCVGCLFQMVNSSRTHRRSGHCALCRSEVKLRDIRMVVLRKKRVQKES